MRMRVGAAVIFLLAGIALTWVIGCRNDINVPYPETLIGDYEGTYSLMQIQGIDTITDTTNSITVRFTNTTYVIKVVATDEKLFFCSSSGEYKLENGVEFVQDEGNLDAQVCTPDNNPMGFFGLDQASLAPLIQIKQDASVDGVRNIKTLLIEKSTN